MTEENPFEENYTNRVETMEENDIDPYPNEYPTDVYRVGTFIEEFNDYTDEIPTDETWKLAGRITRINDFSDFVFYDILDQGDEVQVMCHNSYVDSYEQTEHIVNGDFVVFTGEPQISNTGELTLFAESFQIVSSALDTTPRTDEWDNIQDQEKATNRTSALATDKELYNSVRTKFEMLWEIQQYLNNNGYLSVQTPTIQHYPGGAEAEPFTTEVNDVDMEMALRISPELYLKRLLTVGYNKIYETSRSYRNESTDTTHHPVFTMVEIYETFADYTDMMDLMEDMVASVMQSVCDDTTVTYDSQTIDMSAPWQRLTFDEAIEKYTDLDLSSCSREDLSAYTSEYDLDDEANMIRDELLLEIFDNEVEPNLINPTFITEYPTVSTPLCRTLEDDPNRLQRFEAFCVGFEIGNAYTELTDPRIQKQRFIEQADGDLDDVNMEFVEAIAIGMPPSAGLGIGIDRLAMILTDSQSIKDVIPYPISKKIV